MFFLCLLVLLDLISLLTFVRIPVNAHIMARLYINGKYIFHME